MATSILIISSVLCFIISLVFLVSPQSFEVSSLSPLPIPFLHRHPKLDNGKNWDLLYHLGGNGPWVRKIEGVVEGGLGAPEGCKLDMIHMLSRHGERYPTWTAGRRMIELVRRLKATEGKMKGALSFLNKWEYFSYAPLQHFERLTTTGPYAGTLGAFATGVKFRTRYYRLWNDTTPHPPPTTFWASDSDRVIDTAHYFAAGFFGLDYDERGRAKLEIISEGPERGADTLTPGSTCVNYCDDEVEGHDLGSQKLREFGATYLGNIANRLEEENPGLNFTEMEVFSMQEMCGFETTVRGTSKWCDVFTHEEWLQFEYARDIVHFYRSGQGNKYGITLGWLWLNATAELINEGPDRGSVFFSFSHDGDIVPMLAALGLFPEEHDLPVDHVLTDRRWKTSQIMPMGGRIVFERMTCKASPQHKNSQDGVFIRFNVNDGIVALPGCDTGPGRSCPLERFMEHVAERGVLAGDFKEKCGLPKDAPARLTFLRQPGRD